MADKNGKDKNGDSKPKEAKRSGGNADEVNRHLPPPDAAPNPDYKPQKD